MIQCGVDGGENMVHMALRIGRELLMSHLTSEIGEVGKLASVSKTAFRWINDMRVSIGHQIQLASTVVETTTRDSLHSSSRRRETVLGLLRRTHVSIVLGSQYRHDLLALRQLASTTCKRPFRLLAIEFGRDMSMAVIKDAAAGAAQAYPTLGTDILFIDAGTVYEVHHASLVHKAVRHKQSSMGKEDALDLLHTITGQRREGEMTPDTLASLVRRCNSATGQDHVLSRLIHEAHECLLRCMISVNASASPNQVRSTLEDIHTLVCRCRYGRSASISWCSLH